jgi:hypothetical protein
MGGPDLIDEKTIFSVANKEIKEKFPVPDKMLKELEQKAKELIQMAKKAASAAFQN